MHRYDIPAVTVTLHIEIEPTLHHNNTKKLRDSIPHAVQPGRWSSIRHGRTSII